MKYNLTNKNILITGANSGIGKAAAIQLAKLGANVIMACRSLDRGRQALEEIQNSSGSQTVELMQVDMSLQKSICNFTDQFKATHERLDVLIHNAANFDHSLKKVTLTEDAIETVFATNHLGPFLMTNLLLDMLEVNKGRIITVSSKGLFSYPFLDIEFDNLNGERKFNMQHAYYHAKQAQVMYTFDLAEKLKHTGVTVNCVRVGNVAISDDRLTHLPWWLLNVYKIKRKFSMTPEKMAETYVWLAADPTVAKLTGGYFDAPNTPVKANANAYNRETQKRLWEVSAQLTQSSIHLEP